MYLDLMVLYELFKGKPFGIDIMRSVPSKQININK